MHSATLTLNQFSKSAKNPRRRSVAIFYALAIIAVIAIAAAPTSAQEHWPPGAVARFTGEDISFEGSALGPPIAGGTSFFISSGTVLTVHSGDARLNLPGGGTVDICGPAKLTLLESNAVYTIALNFGRVHIRLADPTQLHVFTPFVMATPISIADEARDLSIGLDINDSMCVFAAQGAARLEDQFSSENMMVPQLGEFFLSGEKLSPTGGPSGACRCFRNEAANQPQMSPSSSPHPKSTQPEIARSTAPPPPTATTAGPPRPSPPPPPRPSAPPVTAAPAPVASPAVATNQAPPTSVLSPHPVPSKPQHPPVPPAQPAPQAPIVAAAQPPTSAPATPAANPFPPASKSKPQQPTASSAFVAQQPPPEITTGAPRSTSVIPTVEAAAPPPPPPAEPTEASNPPAKKPEPPPTKTISGSAPEADNGFTMPDHANQTKPVAVHIFGSTPTAPQLEPPLRVVMPPLTFSNTMPSPPANTDPQLITIVREARVTKEWVFKGHVAETKSPAVQPQPENTKPTPQKRKRRSILTVFKQFFGGNPPPPK
jgi:hypothetical protein